ncbi:MAG: laccase domain-containing protein [Patescibacteria group bacterium]
MSQKNIDLSQTRDLIFFKGLELTMGITTVNFNASDSLPEDHLLLLLGGDYVIRSEPRRLAKIVFLKSGNARNHYSDDSLVHLGLDWHDSPVIVTPGGDEPIVILFNQRLKLVALINGSWENIILYLVRSTISAIRSRINVNVNEISAWIWPGLCRDCFLPPKDLFNYLKAENKKIDLKNIISQQLLDLGIKEGNIYSTNLCSSHSRSDQGYFFHSLSRDRLVEEKNNLLFVKLKNKKD